MPKYDVVYFLTKSNWNEEIRYSLRSFELYFNDLGKVWIIGYLPPYLNRNTVQHESNSPMMLQPGVFVQSVAMRIANKSLAGLSENYIFSADDNYIFTPVNIKDFGPLYVEDLKNLRNRGKSDWQLMLWRTYDILVHMGYSSIYNYESHTPRVVNRQKFSQVSDMFVNIGNAALNNNQSICPMTAYWNITGDAKENHRWANHFRVGFTDNTRNQTEEMILKQLKNITFLYHDDNGLNGHLRRVIKKLYPKKSKFEL